MAPVPSPVRALRRTAAVLALAMQGCMHCAAGGGVVVRDAGELGIVLSNDAVADVAQQQQQQLEQPPPRGTAARMPAPGRRARQFAPLLEAAAHAHGVPEALLQAVIEVESGFDAAAVSPRGALGLMQLLPATARALRVDDPRDPAANIDGGARYLKGLLVRYDHDLALALAAYNAGPGAVPRGGGIPRIPETQRYVPRVILRYHRLQSGSAD